MLVSDNILQKKCQMLLLVHMQTEENMRARSVGFLAIIYK